MDLSNEDSLRLNVLLANELQAVRIDEGKMCLHALSPRGEMKVQLNPNCRDEVYLRQVKELLSGHVLGSPGGYPVYLQRWTRMGQVRDNNLEQLLLLGEPEALVAVVHATGLTPELARRAWWVLQDASHARQMLKNAAVRNSPIGQELATFLLEFLPFEADPLTQAETVYWVLQDNVIEAETRHALWKKNQHKNTYLLGFLWGTPDALPAPQHPDFDVLQQGLQPLLSLNHPVAHRLLHYYSSPGQGFIQLAERILKKPINQEIVDCWLEQVANYFRPSPALIEDDTDWDVLLSQVEHLCQQPPYVEVSQAMPQLQPQLRAMLILGGLSYAVLRPILSSSDAIGALMRKKLAPISTPLFEQLKVLQAPIER